MDGPRNETAARLRATATEEVGEDRAELAAARGQRVLDSRWSLGVHGPDDESRLLEVGQPCRERRRAHIAKAATKLAEPHGAAVGDETQETERVAAADKLGERRRRAEAVAIR